MSALELLKFFFIQFFVKLKESFMESDCNGKMLIFFCLPLILPMCGFVLSFLGIFLLFSDGICSILEIINYLLDKFNDYTYAIIGMYWNSFSEASLGTYKVIEEHEFDALCNDTIIQYTLYIAKYIIIAIGITISNILASAIDGDRSVNGLYTAGLFFICNKIFSSFTSCIKTTTITVFLYLIECYKYETLKVNYNPEYFKNLLDKFCDTEDDFIGEINDYLKEINSNFVFGI